MTIIPTCWLLSYTGEFGSWRKISGNNKKEKKKNTVISPPLHNQKKKKEES